MGELSGKVAFVTGAAHGQGRAAALALAGKGRPSRPSMWRARCPTPATAWELRGAGAARRRLRGRGGACVTFAGDVRDDAAVRAAVDAAVARFGRIDILFNNAGICAYGLAHELTEEAWDAMLDINLKGAWLVARRVIPRHDPPAAV